MYVVFNYTLSCCCWGITFFVTTMIFAISVFVIIVFTVLKEEDSLDRFYIYILTVSSLIIYMWFHLPANLCNSDLLLRSMNSVFKVLASLPWWIFSISCLRTSVTVSWSSPFLFTIKKAINTLNVYLHRLQYMYTHQSSWQSYFLFCEYFTVDLNSQCTVELHTTLLLWMEYTPKTWSGSFELTVPCIMVPSIESLN